MKRDWLIVSIVILVSCALIYVFNPWHSRKPVTPKQEGVIVQPDVKPPEAPKPEVKPETPKPKVPDVVVFESTKGKVTFNHSAHSEAFACKDCHHKTAEGSTPKKCKECHENTFSAFHNKSSTFSCVGCHKEVGAGPGYTPCSGCHKK